MCLVTEQDSYKVAERDMECYKILQVSFGVLGRIIYNTPYTGTRVPRRVVSGKRCFVASGKMSWNYGDFTHVIGRGMIHCYTANEKGRDACKYIYNDMWFNNGMTVFIFKCVIPKGAHFYNSINGSGICSDRIRFIEQIEL